VDLYQLVLGTLDEQAVLDVPTWEEPEWWESVVAVTTYNRERPLRVNLYPLDLAAAQSLAGRGVPARAGGARAAAILTRLSTLSAAMGTRMTVDGAMATIELGGPGGRVPSPDAAAARPPSEQK
jgi:hypothetical protein